MANTISTRSAVFVQFNIDNGTLKTWNFKENGSTTFPGDVFPLANLGVSNTIRGAVGNWSKTIATELAPFGITVNNILPGATETERLNTIINKKSGKLNVERDEIENEMLAEIPMKRFGKPEEPAYAACFLCSEFAAYITGTNIVVDGGRTPCL